MSIEIWIAFVIASSAVLAIPGPTVILVVGYALGHGKRTGWATVPGVTLGDFTAMTASLAGAGALLAASAELFLVLKLFGAAYLIWLGIRLWRTNPEFDVPNTAKDDASYTGMFWNSWLVTSLNPKSIVFFIAFVPQFVNPADTVLYQFIVLEATFLALAAINVAIWVILVGHLRTRFKNPVTLRRVNRTGAGFLIGAGVLTAVVGNHK